MKVLHVITGLGIGGAEQQLRLLLRQLPVSCDVVTLTEPGAVAAGLRADGVRVAHLGMSGNRDLTALPRLTRLIRRGQYDLVHTHLYRACVYGRIAARLAGTRATVATEHSLGHAEIEGRPLTRGTRALYLGTERLGSATVAVSDTVAGRLRAWGVPGPRIHVVPNGIDADRFRFDRRVRDTTRARLGLPDDVYVVGGVGRLVPGKRFDVLIRAVAALPDVRLLLAGEGPEAGALRALAARLGAADRITFLGACATGSHPTRHDSAQRKAARRNSVGPDLEPEPAPNSSVRHGIERHDLAVPALLSAVDTLVSTSREESFGLAVVEALAAGLPVLHTTCPALDDLPGSWSAGATRVPEGADALTQALRRSAEAGPARLPPPPAVGHYAIARSGSRLMDVYRHVLAGVP